MINREIVEELVDGLCSILGNSIHQIILYASVTRREEMPESGIDIAIILD